MRWIVHGERTLYSSAWVDLRLADVEIPGGDRFEHHVVRVPREAAGCVVHDPDQGVLLLWRHRFITDTWGWEIPAGAVDAGREPRRGRCARGAGGDGVAAGAGRAPGHLPAVERPVRPAIQRVPRGRAPSMRAIRSISARPSASSGERRRRYGATSRPIRWRTACRSPHCCSRSPSTASARPARSTPCRPGCTPGTRSTYVSGARQAAPRCCR